VSERLLLLDAVGLWAPGGIHHVGSTSVPGLAAKPVIDMLVGVRDLDDSRTCLHTLENGVVGCDRGVPSAERFEHDRAAYTAAKTDFVEQALRDAL